MLFAEMSLDVLDRQLITVLKEDGRMSYTDLAQRLGVTEGTARNRLQRMIGSDTLRIVPIVDQTQRLPVERVDRHQVSSWHLPGGG